MTWPRTRPLTTSLKSRVLILEFDSMLQAARFDAASSPAEAIEELTGILRTALLVTDRVTLVDSMVFDGMYFAHMPPDALAQALGVHASALPIEILIEKDTLAASLQAKRDKDFAWQTHGRIDPQRREAAWSAWVDMDGRVRTAPYGSMPPLTAPRREWAASLSAPARALLDEIAAELGRTVAVSAIDRARTRHPADPDVRAVGRWWHNAYNIAIADAVEADWLRFDATETTLDSLGSTAPGRRRIALSRSIVGEARALAASQFSAARASTRTTRTRLRSGWAGWSWWHLRSLTYAVREAQRGPGLFQAIADAFLRLGIAAFAILLAIPGLTDILARQGWAWGIFALTAVLTVPVGAVWLLFRLARGDTAPLLSIRVDGARS